METSSPKNVPAVDFDLKIINVKGCDLLLGGVSTFLAPSSHTSESVSMRRRPCCAPWMQQHGGIDKNRLRCSNQGDKHGFGISTMFTETQLCSDTLVHNTLSAIGWKSLCHDRCWPLLQYLVLYDGTTDHSPDK